MADNTLPGELKCQRRKAAAKERRKRQWAESLAARRPRRALTRNVHKLILIMAAAYGAVFFVPTPFDWHVGNIVMLAQIAILATFACGLIEYSNLRIKSLLAAFSAFSWLDLALYPLRYSVVPFYLYVVEIAVAVLFLLWIYRKWYGMGGDDLDNESIFLVLKKVETFKELVISLFCSDPAGSFSVYARGGWYHFRKSSGHLEKARGETLQAMSSKYIFKRIRAATSGDIDRLDASVGERWSVFHNCVSEFKKWG